MFNKNIFKIFIVFFSLLAQAQEYRYTNTIFSSSNSTGNVVYQTAPSINSPYTIESNTLNEDLKMDIYLPVHSKITCTLDSQSSFSNKICDNLLRASSLNSL